MGVATKIKVPEVVDLFLTRSGTIPSRFSH